VHMGGMDVVACVVVVLLLACGASAQLAKPFVKVTLRKNTFLGSFRPTTLIFSILNKNCHKQSYQKRWMCDDEEPSGPVLDLSIRNLRVPGPIEECLSVPSSPTGSMSATVSPAPQFSDDILPSYAECVAESARNDPKLSVRRTSTSSSSTGPPRLHSSPSDVSRSAPSSPRRGGRDHSVSRHGAPPVDIPSDIRHSNMRRVSRREAPCFRRLSPPPPAYDCLPCNVPHELILWGDAIHGLTLEDSKLITTNEAILLTKQMSERETSVQFDISINVNVSFYIKRANVDIEHVVLPLNILYLPKRVEIVKLSADETVIRATDETVHLGDISVVEVDGVYRAVFTTNYETFKSDVKVVTSVQLMQNEAKDILSLSRGRDRW